MAEDISLNVTFAENCRSLQRTRSSHSLLLFCKSRPNSSANASESYFSSLPVPIYCLDRNSIVFGGHRIQDEIAAVCKRSVTLPYLYDEH